MFTFTHWLDRFGDQVSKMREAETGVITLVYNSELDEDLLEEMYRAGVKPKDAAKRFLLNGEGQLPLRVVSARWVHARDVSSSKTFCGKPAAKMIHTNPPADFLWPGLRCVACGRIARRRGLIEYGPAGGRDSWSRTEGKS